MGKEMSSTTEFWQGEFGDSYTERNRGEALIKNNVALFRRALLPMFYTSPMRVVEFGANIGLNILALQQINAFSACEYAAIEPNAKAAEELAGVPQTKVYHTSIQDADAPWGGGYDLSLSKGVLIHIHPDDLFQAYAALYKASRRFIFLAEYHNPTPAEVIYRGETGRLWKRDFAAEMLNMFSDLRVSNYGFAWKFDPNAPQDDLVFTLLEKV